MKTKKLVGKQATILRGLLFAAEQVGVDHEGCFEGTAYCRCGVAKVARHVDAAISAIVGCGMPAAMSIGWEMIGGRELR